MPEADTFKRLPTAVSPTHYNITLHPNLEKCTFSGTVDIEIEVKKTASQIVLNCVNLDVSDISLDYLSEDQPKDLKPKSTAINKSKEILEINFDQMLPSGLACLSIGFMSELNDKLKGFYRSKYTSKTGEERYAAVTQFEATDARRCFPCWDEPAIKATFDITLIVPKNRVALSNMPEAETLSYEADPNFRIIKFATSPRMSTYLVAIVVGEFDYVEAVTKDNVKIRVYTPVDKKEQGRFALDVAAKALPYYNEYYKIVYPLPKLDLIAISDFCVGAMENWGLITYRETCLLVDPHNTSAFQKQSISLTVAHELAHMWFGNLVTMEWWTHLWLNEGFASFIERLCINFLFPEFDVWPQFITNCLGRALNLDCLKSSHPIEVPVSDPEEVDEIFDCISYHKGCSVIRMLHNYIGDEDFRSGMNLYLSRHAYSNTVTEDLWKALEKASGKPIGSVMSTWTKQMGFPLVSVSAEQHENNTVVTISQQRFLADGTTDANSLWMIPISFACATSPKVVIKQMVLEERTGTVVLEGITAMQGIKINPGCMGVYRTKYSSAMLSSLMPSIQSNAMPAIDRLGILTDVFALAQSGQTSTVEVLQLMQAYRDETNYTVWAAIHSCLAKLNQLLAHSDTHLAFKAFARKLLANVFVRVGWEAKQGEGHLDALLRSLVLDQLGLYGDACVQQEAKRRLQLHIAGTEVIPADIRAAVYMTVLSTADEQVYRQMIMMYKEVELHEEKDRIMRSLGAATDPNIIQNVLEFAISDSVRSQDSVFGIIGVGLSASGRNPAWNFYKKHHQEICAKYDGGALVTILVKHLTENFCSSESAHDVSSFFSSHPVPSATRTIQQSLENIRLNTSWLQRDLQHIHRFLSAAAQENTA